MNSVMIRDVYKIRAKVWVHVGTTSAWHMATLPKKESREIKALFGELHRGWSSLPVLVTIGKTKWRTSIFFDRSLDAYILPLKASVRRAETLSEGKTIAFTLEIHP